MIERLRKTVASLSLVAVAFAAGCGGSGSVEIPIQTPIAPKLDISPFQRVYVAGFLAGASPTIRQMLGLNYPWPSAPPHDPFV